MDVVPIRVIGQGGLMARRIFPRAVEVIGHHVEEIDILIDTGNIEVGDFVRSPG